MKNIFIFVLMFSASAFASVKDYTEVEVIKILKATFPDSGNIIVTYKEKTDDWVFQLNTAGQCLGCGQGVIKDDKKNPEITIWREG